MAVALFVAGSWGMLPKCNLSPFLSLK